MKNIYVGMALSGAPESFRTDFQHALKNKLRVLPDVAVLDFSWTAHGPEANSDISVYELDKKNTEEADLCVFIIDHTSLGLGMEMMICYQTNKPSLFFVHREFPMRISRMILGYIEQTNQMLTKYESVDDIVNVGEQYIANNF